MPKSKTLSKSLSAGGLRRSVYQSHSIYYRVDPDEIVIIRILGQQDMDDAFLEESGS